MSGDQLASSFGDPNAQPPTPKQIPTSAFPSPVLETPKHSQNQFDEAGGWTPRFAEEYSVFNPTPGSLRVSQGAFADVERRASYPLTPLTGRKRPLSPTGLAAEIATHVNHFSPNPNQPLPPVDPSRRLQSSPRPLNLSEEYSGDSDNQTSPQPHSEERSAKKARKGHVSADFPDQIATPPHSARKGERKLAPKALPDSMQNDQGFGQPDFMGTPQQPTITTFATTPQDMFGYPMSAPATAPATFWDPSVPMPGMMDMDFTGADATAFQPSHRQIGSFDWNNDAQLFQDPGTLPPSSNQENIQPVRRERPLASKAMMPGLETGASANNAAASTFPTPIDDPFGIGTGTGVDPGLLFGTPQSSLGVSDYGTMAQAGPTPSMALPDSVGLPSNEPSRGDIRRSLSMKEPGHSRQLDRAAVSSPIKASGRPSLQRSFSEARGKRALARAAALPTLAPAIRPQPQPASGSGVGGSRSVSTRPSGRTSPVKAHHQRLSSLSSIPESGAPRTRTSVKFTIDARGRARAETTVIVDEPPSGGIHRRRTSRDLVRKEPDWDLSSDESTTDDEPIIIPSRNASFALPDPRKPVGSIFHSSKKSVSERSSTSTHATVTGDAPLASQNDGESEAETVLNEQAGKVGDAISELRRVREDRQKRSAQLGSGQRTQRFLAGGFSGFQGNEVSPTALTDGSVPTPSTDARSHTIRCVCNRNDPEVVGDMYMVQCHSCELWLHGRCINISRRTMPPVYICAFCANTPNMRGGRMRDTGRGSLGQLGSAPSPLTHKSFKSFR